jgi:hypothetical protein
MTISIKLTPGTLHSQLRAESIAKQCAHNDNEWKYVAIQWGPVYWVVEISDEDGLIGYL